LSPNVFSSELEAVTFLRLAGKTIRTLVADLSPIVDTFQDEVLRYIVHELTKVEQMTLHAERHCSSFPFQYVASLLDKNRETLSKLCLNLPLEGSQLKHFTTLVLNMHHLKHLHLTSSTSIEKHSAETLSPLKHVFSKDSLTTIIIDSYPLQDDFGIIGFSTNLKCLVLGIVITEPRRQTRRDYCSFVF
jgi:hypothetical protein